jgi:hypothetical protein
MACASRSMADSMRREGECRANVGRKLVALAREEAETQEERKVLNKAQGTPQMYSPQTAYSRWKTLAAVVWCGIV